MSDNPDARDNSVVLLDDLAWENINRRQLTEKQRFLLTNTEYYVDDTIIEAANTMLKETFP